MIEAPFASSAGKSSSGQNTRELLINMFVEKADGGRGQIIRVSRPGLLKNYAVSGERRGVARLLGADYAVIGDGFYRVSTVSATRLGSLSTGTGRCSFAENTTQIAVCDGVGVYVWDGTAFSRITLPVSAAGSIAGIDNYGMLSDRNSGRYFRTNLNDFKTIDPLNFATAEGQPDKLVRIFVDHREAWLFGERSIEVTVNSGKEGFGFQRLNGVMIERGCAAAMSVASEDNALFWLGDDGWVYRADGYRPARISTGGIERLIADAAPWSDAYAWVYTIPDHRFYVLTFPGRLTVAFDIASGVWHQARTWGQKDWAVVGPHKMGPAVILGHDGVCQLVQGLPSDAGGILERGGISAPLYADGRNIIINAHWLDLEMGRTTTVDDPQVMLQVSRDGETWGNVRTRGLGATGQFNRRAVWRGLGMSRKFMMRFSVTDPAPFTVIGARIEAEALNS